MLGSSSSKGGGNNSYDYSFKILLIGDSGVGKSSLLVSFISNFVHDLSPTIVYDVTRRETFTNLSEIWAKEVELYSTNHECIKILVGNKVDRDSERAVTREEGMALAQEHKCSFLECSAKTRENVHQCFKDLILKVLEVPALREKGSAVVKKQILQQKQEHKVPQSNGCCFQ
ncbi:Rab gtpase c2a, alpha,atrab,atrab18b,atrabc2a,rabc2a isoform 3 [Theobroma cacao]|uniref:Rab gtpase c2a, alpha,atrab,atrab18b,atrabc2a,rabc2a isoform 3 n=1 Tax=Theobroma cacao TaxID=3641 RepID=A0A061FP53_THECC|nr:Rab gtpase c2a, alpha,atrab,atrab18b,atrabc2a,rabc2a isoform 3 [Theobroma cacao]